MINLYEVHESTVDAKGRIMLPAAYKKQLDKVLRKGFIIKRSIFSKSLALYPMSTWNEMMREVNKLNRFVKKNVEFIRMFNYGVKSVALDNNNRFLVLKDLLDYAGIKKDIVMSSASDHIEIWDKKTYERFIKDNSEYFEKLTEEVMGNINPGSSDGK